MDTLEELQLIRLELSMLASPEESARDFLLQLLVLLDGRVCRLLFMTWDEGGIYRVMTVKENKWSSSAISIQIVAKDKE